MPIQILSPEVASQIAAGEIVERPASVAKELIENALDAGATRIVVEIRKGGVEFLQVTDNGCGIPSTELETAFQRHATSKISCIQDLDSISTLGFRGEALYAIASVAEITAISRQASSSIGNEIRFRNGRVSSRSPRGCGPGTSVAVHNLFERVPARYRFLKSEARETARITETVIRFILAFPGVGFSLLNERRTLMFSPGNNCLRDAVVAVYGMDVAKTLLEIDATFQDGYAIDGFISPQSVHRSNRTYISLLVNTRWVQSRLMTYALETAYHGFLPQGRYPLAVLRISVPFIDVDVNVHPFKREVKFSQEDKVFRLIQRESRKILVTHSPVPQLAVDTSQLPDEITQLALDVQPASLDGTVQTNQYPGIPRLTLPELQVVGQVGTTYIVAEGPGGMYLIDQHAAHERVLYEEVLENVKNRIPQAQTMLEPMVIELSPGDQTHVSECGEMLSRYGFSFENFGDNAILLRSVSPLLVHGLPEQGFLEILHLLAEEKRMNTREEALAASIACHSSVRAGMTLDHREMQELIGKLGDSQIPNTCPHGRPTMFHLSSNYLARVFGRT